jgi:hypothetical protein
MGVPQDAQSRRPGNTAAAGLPCVMCSIRYGANCDRIVRSFRG